MSQKIKTSVEIDGSLSASQIANATTDTDKFLVSDGGTIKYRTGAELATDLGIAAGVTSKVQHQVKVGVAINKGQAVYVTGADGTNMIVGLASNTTEATSSKTMGLLNATVSANGFADVITEGLLDGLDTSSAVAGNPVWLGTGGNLIYGLANKPYAPSHLVFIGIVTRVNANNGEIFVKVQNGFELDELHDVDLKTTTPINGHLLGFNGTLWVNKTIAGWLGYTPQAQLNGTGFVKSSGTTITYDNTSYYPASNPSGYISSYTETDTLASVTGRGNTTNSNITVASLIIPSFETATNVLSLRSGIPDGTNVGIRAKAIATANRDGLELLGYNGIDFTTNNGANVAVRISGNGNVHVGGSTSSYKFHVAGGQYGTYLKGGDLGTGSDILRLVDASNNTKYLARGDGKHFFTGDTDIQGNLTISGTLSASGYNKTNWDTAYGWGNHASAGYVPQARTITINGTSYDLSANRSWTVTASETDTLASVTGRGATTNTLSTFDGGLNIGNAKLRWGTNTSPTLGFPFTGGPNGFWIDVNDGDTGGIVIDNDGTTIYGAGDSGHVFRVIDEDVYQATSNVDASTTFRVQQGQNGGGYIRGVFEVTDYLNAGNSARAPILYDSNDTAYYVDPASTSNISKLRITSAGNSSGGNILMGPAGEGTNKWSYLTGTHYNATSEAKGVSIIGLYTNSTGNTISIGGAIYEANPATQIDFYTHNAITHSTGGTRRMYIDSGGNVVAASNMQAPIFYDSNDTGYYWNPATDTSHRFQTPSGYIDIGPKNGGYCHIYTDRPSFYFNAQLEVLGNRVLNAGNYGNYAWPLEGSWKPSSLASSTRLRGATSPDGGEFGLAYSGGQIHPYTDGFFYQNEGQYRVIDSGSIGSQSVNYANSAGSAGSAFGMPYDGNGISGMGPISTWDSRPGVGMAGFGINWHTGVSISGYPGYGGVRLYASGYPTHSSSVLRLEASDSVKTYGILYNNESVRSPIFYDSNNTGYYIDPASTSNLNALTVNGTLTGNLSGRADRSIYLDTNYVGGQQLNPQTYFNNGVGLKVAMTAAAGVWSDTLWINGYAGGDVLQMCAMHFQRNGTPRAYISNQASTGTSYGSLYEFWTTYNMDAPNKSGTSYYQTNTWMQLNGAYGLYCPSVNGAHFYPNNSTYGAWKVEGTRNGWGGIEFVSGNGNPTLMISGDSNTVGIHNNSYGWQLRWANGNLYSARNSYGGNETIVLQEDKWIGSKYFGGDGAIYGTVFYDANSSDRYLDPSSTGDSIRVSGDVVAYYSDERLKDRKGNIENALDKVLSLNGFYYTPNSRAQELGYSYKEEVGVSAQEVEAILPEIIKDAPIGHGYKTLNYGKLTPLLIEAIKEQQTQIEELKQLVNKLINK